MTEQGEREVLDEGAGRSDREGQPESADELRRRGLAVAQDVYGWEFQDGPGDFYGLTIDHLFAQIWTRPDLTRRDRRLLLLGLLVGRGHHDVADIQVQAALAVGDLSPEELRETVVFLSHYAGWPDGAKLNTTVETAIRRRPDPKT